MAENLVDYRLEPPAAILTLNRPERRNALSEAVVIALSEAFARAESDASRVIILTGTGAMFSTGLDLMELHAAAHDREHIRTIAARLATLYERIRACPKPTIAAINGSAFAGGAGLITVCDLAIAVPEAEICYFGVRRGLAPAVIMPPLVRLVGERVARQLLLTAEPIDAANAARVGLINAVVPAAELHDRAMALARSLAEGGPNALALTKKFLLRLDPNPISVEELSAFDSAAWTCDEAKQGLEAFANKTDPPWIR